MKRTTVLALGAFAALLAIVLVTREDKVNEGVPKLVLPALTADVTQADFTGAVTAKLEKSGADWKVNGFKADAAQVKAFTDAAKDFRVQDFVTEKTERHAELEVDDAKGVKVALSTASGPAWTLVFGKAAKTGGNYVREAKSNAVFTTNSPVAYHVKKTVAQWRLKAITTAPSADMVKVAVTRTATAFTLVNNAGAWTLDPVPPAPFRFDGAAATRLVQQLGNLQAQDFAAEPDPTSDEQIEVTLKDGKTLSLKLGAKRPDNTVPLTVQGDAQVYLLAQWSADQLLKTQEDLRDTSLLAFEPDKVNRFSLSFDGKSTTLAKEASGWKVLEPKAAPAGFELDPQLVAQQLARLKGLRAARAMSGVADAAAGFGKPTMTVELAVEGGAKQVLKFGGELPTKELYVKGTADGLTYAINNNERQTLMQGLDLFKKRPPPDMSQMRGLEQLPPEVRRQLEAQLRQRTN